MLFKAGNLYHPFRNTTLGFFPKDFASSEMNMGETIEHIDLYYQPIQIPLIATVFFVIKICLLMAGEYLQFKVYIMIQKENGLVKNVTRLFVCTQMIFWPFWVFFATSTDFIHPLNQVIGQWYCTVGFFIFYILGNIIIFHSFITALMRYVFILHKEKVDKYGKEKIQKLFLLLSVLIPLLLFILGGVDGDELDPMSFFNKCNGKHHRVFLIETATLNVAKRNFCGLNNYDKTGSFGKLTSLFRQMSCITNKIVQIIMGLNIVEGFLYIRTLSHVNK